MKILKKYSKIGIFYNNVVFEAIVKVLFEDI